MNALPRPSQKALHYAQEKQREQERIQDVLLLIDSLYRREKVTAKLVLECLYDIGYVNFMNEKVGSRPLQKLGKGVARLSKPLFLQLGLMWFLDNCPKLTTDWLHSLVVFEETEATESTAISTEANKAIPAEVWKDADGAIMAEVKRLRQQARLSAGVAIVAVLISIGTVFYASSRLQMMPWQWSQSSSNSPTETHQPTANRMPTRQPD